jgi:hypothetical protein
MNYNFASSFVLLWNSVCHTEDGAKSEVLWEQDVEEDMWDERDEVNRERRRLYNEEICDI